MRLPNVLMGASALAMHDSNPLHIDLLLTDIVMPGMNGHELAEAMSDRQPKLKVLYITGYSRNAIVHQGRLDPGVSLLQKPLTQTVLSQKIREHLDGGKPDVEQKDALKHSRR